MKWFKHISKSRNDAMIRDAISLFGLAGEHVFWRTLELMADEFQIRTPGYNKFFVKSWKKNYDISVKKTIKILQFFQNYSDKKKRIYFKIRGKGKKQTIQLNCPKLRELCDTWTQNQLRKTSKSLRSRNEVKTKSYRARARSEAEVEEDKELSSYEDNSRQGGDHFKFKVGDYLDVILSEIDLIKNFPQNGKLFDQRTLFQWIQEKANMSGHPKAIFKSLSWLKSNLENGEEIRSFRAFAESTFKTVNPKYHGRDSEAESQAFKNAVIEDPRIKEILKGIGN